MTTEATYNDFTQTQLDYVAGVSESDLRNHLLHQVRLRDNMEKDRDQAMLLLNKHTEKFNIIFKEYPETIQLSKERAKKYIKMKGAALLNKTQQKLLNSDTYSWKERGVGTAKGSYLYDNAKQEFVIKNPKAAGTPNVKPINGQYFWQGGAGLEWTRQAIKDQLRTYFVPAIMRQLPEKIFPPKDHFIQFEYLFFYPFDQLMMHKHQDIINHCYPYMKSFEDVLVEMEKIKDDNPTIVQSCYSRYISIPTTEQRRLEVKIHFCKNNERIS